MEKKTTEETEAREFGKFMSYLEMFITKENFKTLVLEKTEESMNIYVFTDGEKSNEILTISKT